LDGAADLVQGWREAASEEDSAMSSQTTATSLVERFRQGYENFGKGDLEAIRADFAPEIVWHNGGHNILTGDYKGIDECFKLFMRIFEETGGTFKNEIHDILANETHGVAMVKATGTRKGKTLENNIVNIVHYNAEGQITESWIIPEDATAADEFWA
jgi:ketosteroid isomerase-like protein